MVCIFVRLQVTVGVPAGEERRGNRGEPDPPAARFISAVARGFTRRQLRWRVNPRATTVSSAKNLPALFGAFPCSYCRFLGFYFVIFEM